MKAFRVMFKPFERSRKVKTKEVNADSPKQAKGVIKSRYPKSELVAVFSMKRR